MFINNSAVDAGVKILLEVCACSDNYAKALAERVFTAMMEHYSSGPRLVRYSLSPQLQISDD